MSQFMVFCWFDRCVPLVGMASLLPNLIARGNAPVKAGCTIACFLAVASTSRTMYRGLNSLITCNFDIIIV